jgi:hypothetical protein
MSKSNEGRFAEENSLTVSQESSINWMGSPLVPPPTFRNGVLMLSTK